MELIKRNLDTFGFALAYSVLGLLFTHVPLTLLLYAGALWVSTLYATLTIDRPFVWAVPRIVLVLVLLSLWYFAHILLAQPLAVGVIMGLYVTLRTELSRESRERRANRENRTDRPNH